MKAKGKKEKKQLVERLQDVYDKNYLDSRDEVTVLDAIETLGTTDDLNW